MLAAPILWSMTVAHPRQNFILYQPDEMRAESLGAYGHPLKHVSPNLNKFASNGVRFEQAHASYTVCTQSRVAFMTGWPTHVRGHRSLWHLMHDWEPNLLKTLKRTALMHPCSCIRPLVPAFSPSILPLYASLPARYPARRCATPPLRNPTALASDHRRAHACPRRGCWPHQALAIPSSGGARTTCWRTTLGTIR